MDPFSSQPDDLESYDGQGFQLCCTIFTHPRVGLGEGASQRQQLADQCLSSTIMKVKIRFS